MMRKQASLEIVLMKQWEDIDRKKTKIIKKIPYHHKFTVLIVLIRIFYEMWQLTSSLH